MAVLAGHGRRRDQLLLALALALVLVLALTLVDELGQDGGRRHGRQQHHDHAGAEEFLRQDGGRETEGGEHDADLTTGGHAHTDDETVFLDHEPAGELPHHGDGREGQPVHQHGGVEEDGGVHDGTSVDEEDRADAGDQVVDEVLDRVVAVVLALAREEVLLEGDAGEVGTHDGREARVEGQPTVEQHEAENHGLTRLHVQLAQPAHELGGQEVADQRDDDDEADGAAHLQGQLHGHDATGHVEGLADGEHHQGQHVVDDGGVDDDLGVLLVEDAQLTEHRGRDAHGRGGEDATLEQRDLPGGVHRVEGVGEATGHRDDDADDRHLPARLGVLDELVDVALEPSLEQQQHRRQLSQALDEGHAVLAADLLHDVGVVEQHAVQDASEESTQHTRLVELLGEPTSEDGEDHCPAEPQEVSREFSVHGTSNSPVQMASRLLGTQLAARLAVYHCGIGLPRWPTAYVLSSNKMRKKHISSQHDGLE